MTEDNIIRPVFGKQPETITNLLDVSEYTYPEPLSKEMLARAREDFVFMVTEAGFVHDMRNRLEEASAAIFDLKDFNPHEKSIELRREGISSYTLKEICQEIEKTHLLRWKSQPSYLGALLLEYHCHVHAALSLLPDKKSSGDR